MPAIPPRQRATLARRIAAGLPVWAAARGSNLPAEEVGELMWENEFRELIGAWAEIFEMDAEARKRRLLRLAHAIIEDRLAADDPRTALFIEREYKRGRDPVFSLAKGFSQLVEREQAKAEREQARAERARQAAAESQPEPAPPPSPLSAAVAAAEAARKLRATLDPQDAAMWRQAGKLRREMFDEQVLHHAVVRKADLDRRLSPPRAAYPAEDFEVEDFEVEDFEPDLAEAEPLPSEPETPEQTDEKEETDEKFSARATALFNATLSQAPPELRAILETFTQEQLWALIAEAGGMPPEDEGGGAQPLGP